MSRICSSDESASLASLINPVDADRFREKIRRLHTLFEIYTTTCPEPLPTPELIVTPEIRTQCERYLPLADISAVFNRLYSAALSYPPILSSTPFHKALSWADVFAALPPQFQFSANPARLLEALLANRDLLTRFLFASFLPGRFYGCMGRYPGQQEFVRRWLAARKAGMLRCLDAACGTGEDTYGLAEMLMKESYAAEHVLVEGWTIEPLEVWTATRRCFPHERHRESALRRQTAGLFARGYGACTTFSCVDVLKTPPLKQFDLVICNGLLGGPIVHEPQDLKRAAERLATLLAPVGILLAADNFHGGWKQQCPQDGLRALFEENGLITFEAGEGFGGLKPD